MNHETMVISGVYDLRLVVLSFVVAIMASYTAFDLAGRVAAAQGRLRLFWIAGGALVMGLGIWSMHFVGMLAFSLPLAIRYDIPIVLLSILIAVLASGLALFIMGRPTLDRLQWLAGGTLMGLAIAAMHYTGMAGMRMPADIHYHPLRFGLSILIAIGAAYAALGIAFRLRRKRNTTRPWLKIGSALIMGSAICGMHYTAMTAAVFTAADEMILPDQYGLETYTLGAVAIGAGMLLILGFALLTALIDRRFAAQVAAAERLRRSEERLRRVGEHLRDQLNFTNAVTNSLAEGVCALDREGRITFANPAAVQMLGRTQAELLGQQLQRVLGFQYADGCSQPVDEARLFDAIGSEKSFCGENIVLVRSDGSAFPVSYSSSPLYSNKELIGSVVAFRDITERKRAEAMLRESEEFHRLLIDGAKDYAIFMLDPSGHIVSWNAGAERVKGYRADEIIGQHFSCFYPPEDVEHGKPAHLLEVAAREGRIEDEGWRVRKDERRFWANVVITALRDEAGNIRGFSKVTRDITERKLFEQELSHLAFHDPLTNLPNRVLFLDRLEHALARAARHKEKVAVLFLDIDRFKLINDSLGHTAGDQLLIGVADRLRKILRAEDTIARLGGDEFTILLENVVSGNNAVHVAERVRECLQESMTVAGQEITVTTSIGIALSGDEYARPTDLVRDADIAMYRAKRAGKAHYEIFDTSMNDQALQRLELEGDLRRAVARGEFTVYYQPKVELATGKLVGMEALVRWEHPVHGMVSPAEFIPLAEETGLILPIGQYVLAEACRQVQAWQQQYPSVASLMVAVNLSVRQFQHQQLVQDVARILEQTGLAAGSLVLEITESGIMEDAETNSATLWNLKGLGVRLAIDDFGTGYSSLSYLKRFPVDMLKVDKSFVAGLGRDAEDTAIVRAVITLAHTLGMHVTAEGIETADQLSRLQVLGCELGQGYYFGRPLPSHAATTLLADQLVLEVN